jgi:Ni,Fe-hydrogenase I cytochrome b subunit
MFPDNFCLPVELEKMECFHLDISYVVLLLTIMQIFVEFLKKRKVKRKYEKKLERSLNIQKLSRDIFAVFKITHYRMAKKWLHKIEELGKGECK